MILQVCVADAQGLRLMRGGEIRLVLTLRAADDPEGETFGAKVTPWQGVPENEAPQWTCRQAIFTVPTERGLQPEFIGSAYLHIALMQRGHSAPAGSSFGGAGSAGGEASRGGLGLLARGVVGALQETRSALLRGGTRGEVVGSLKLPVGAKLACPASRGDSGTGGASWVYLHEESTGSLSLGGATRVKGSLLLETTTALKAPQSRPAEGAPAATQTQQEQPSRTPEQQEQSQELGSPPAPAANAQPPEAKAEDDSSTPAEAGSPKDRVVDELPEEETQSLPGPAVASPRCEDDVSDSGVSAEGAASDFSTSRGSTTSTAATTSATRADDSHAAPAGNVPAATSAAGQATPRGTVAAGAAAAASPTQHASVASTAPSDSERQQSLAPATQLAPEDRWVNFVPPAAALRPAAGGRDVTAFQWQPFHKGPAAKSAFNASGSFNIFTINDPNASAVDTSAGSDGRTGRLEPSKLKDLIKKLAPRPTTRMRPLKERMRLMMNPEARKHRKEVRKWRRRHEIFCVLNEIEQRLSEVLSLLKQAAASMCRFGESHTELCDVLRLSAFLRDAGLYFRSEAQVPNRVETHLGELERIADDFRNISLDALPTGDVAALEVAEEDAALARATGEHLDLQRACEDSQVDIAVLLESALMTAQQALAEYKKMHCRLELLATEYAPNIRLELDPSRPIFLPLIMDNESTQVAAADVPDQAVQWALDFSQLVGASSQGLEGLVRELGNRRVHLRSCATELREHILRRAACCQIEGTA